MDRSFDRTDKSKTETDYFAHGENEESIKIYEAKTIQEKLDIRFSETPRDNVALVAKENILGLPFKGEPHPDYPSPWLTINFGQFGDLVKAAAYVIKKKFDLPPFSRVAVISNALPHYQLICYALWYNRCTVVSISPKLGNDVKQFWVRSLDIKMIFYDVNLIIYNEKKQKPLNEGGEWIWPWEYPLNEDELTLSAGVKGIPMFFIYQKDFCEEIYQAKLQGKSFRRQGQESDIVLINGTSSSTQAIIKNGQCSKMKFVPFNAHNCTTPYQNFLIKSNKKYISCFVNVPFFFTLGNSWVNTYALTYGGPTIYHTQQIYDVGFIPENMLDDFMETNPDRALLFPFHYAEIKKLFDDNHPRCPIWREYLKAKEKHTFRVSGAPLSKSISKWFRDEFDIKISNEYGSSEASIMMYYDVDSEILPGEEDYLTRIPWNDFYLKPLDDKDPNIGELYTHSSFSISGYARKAEKGEFYESPIPGVRTDVEADELFTIIDGLRFYKTNDIWIRSPKSGKYKYVSRVDDVLAFATGLKMNPLPFEQAVTLECKDVNHCCLILDDTQNDVVCFTEPNWSEIIMEDGTPFDTTIDPTTMTKEEIIKLRKIAQKQVWNTIYNFLDDDSNSLNSWTKQLTINNIFIIDYGRKFPVTGKGSLARRVAKLEYAYVLKRISKLISGEISEIGEEEDIIEGENEGGHVDDKEIVKLNNGESNTKEVEKEKETPAKGEKNEEIKENKSQEEINDEIQKAVMVVYEAIKEIIPSTPEFEDFDIRSPFTLYGIDSIATRKLTNVLARETKKPFSPATLFNYGNPLDLAKYITGYDDKVTGKESIPKSLKEKKLGEKIAVIGMALRLPGAINNAKSFWMALAKGRDCVVAPVKDRNLHTGYVDKPAHLLGEHEHNIPRCGCYDTRSSVAKPSEFDAEFFNLLPEEATSIDPRQRWVLETSWEALENAGIAPNSLENTITGVFVGVNDDHEYQDLMKENGITPAIAAHSSPSGIVGRLSYFYKLFGPSYTVDTACSTGATALHTACRSLQFGDCDLSIVSGVKYMYSSESFHKTSIARMTSPSGRCATFDKDADGFAPGEGCVTFILKRYEDAVRDHDNILSVILGTSSGQSGLRQSISAPSSDGQVINLKRALEFAGVQPEDISFVEAHGTGTPLGDAIEVDALNQVYGGTHSPENPLVIGSVKTNIGHTCETAGLASMAKVILAMQHKYIPKNLHFNTLNPEIDIQSIPLQIATKTTPWETKDNKPRIAQISSFGLQGSIVHIILQEYVPETETESKSKSQSKEEEEKSGDSQENHILTISAKSLSALSELGDTYLTLLENMEDNQENIENLCYTSNIGRQHFDFRICASGKNATELYDDLIEQLDAMESSIEEDQSTRGGHGITQILEVYAEKASQTTIPAKIYETIEELLVSNQAFKSIFEFCDAEVQKVFEGLSLKKLVEEKKPGMKDHEKRQLLLLSFYYSVQKSLESVMIKDSSSKVICGGFGFGEIISLVLCGGLTLSSAYSLIKTVTGEGNISSWYAEQNIPKLEKSVFMGSLEKELKSGETISEEDLMTMVKNMDEIKESSEFFDQYDRKSKMMKLFSTDEEINETFETEGSGHHLSILKFYDEEIEKNLYEEFIKKEYKQGQNINWEVYNDQIPTDHSVHKIELPTYPFQRSVYWPVPLKH